MEHLREAIDALQRAREAKLAELRAIEEALDVLGGPTTGGTQGRQTSRDFEHLGIVEAASHYLNEQREPRTTREIADALLNKGIKTRSRNYVATVYSTLDNAAAFHRTKDGKWALVEATT